MLTSLTAENAAKYFYLADLHQLEVFKEQIANFIGQNQSAVRNSTAWKEFIGKEQLQQLYDSLLRK